MSCPLCHRPARPKRQQAQQWCNLLLRRAEILLLAENGRALLVKDAACDKDGWTFVELKEYVPPRVQP